MKIEEMFDNETVNKIKRDSNAYDHALRADCEFINMIENGLVKVVGVNSKGEVEYSLSEEGRKFVTDAQAQDQVEKARDQLRAKGGVRL
jgi:hypothetical protein